MKNYANRKLRRKKLEHNYQHNAYKKDFCKYDICDYYTIETKNFDLYYEKIVHRWYNHWHHWFRELPFPDREKTYQEYMKWYIRK
mgnify:CR=1 FL=1